VECGNLLPLSNAATCRGPQLPEDLRRQVAAYQSAPHSSRTLLINYDFSRSYLYCEQVSKRDGSRDFCGRGQETIAGS
jgi:hypothetical protein